MTVHFAHRIRSESSLSRCSASWDGSSLLPLTFTRLSRTMGRRAFIPPRVRAVRSVSAGCGRSCAAGLRFGSTGSPRGVVRAAAVPGAAGSRRLLPKSRASLRLIGAALYHAKDIARITAAMRAHVCSIAPFSKTIRLSERARGVASAIACGLLLPQAWPVRACAPRPPGAGKVLLRNSGCSMRQSPACC